MIAYNYLRLALGLFVLMGSRRDEMGGWFYNWGEDFWKTLVITRNLFLSTFLEGAGDYFGRIGGSRGFLAGLFCGVLVSRAFWQKRVGRRVTLEYVDRDRPF